MVFFSCSLTMISILGLYVLCAQSKKKSYNCLIGIYALLVFFVGFLPMLGQGGAIIALQYIDDDLFKTACNADPAELKQIRDTAKLGRLTANMATTAKGFDRYTQGMLNRLMCTGVCPCFHKPEWK